MAGAGGVLDSQGLYLGRQYIVLFALAAVAATPLFTRLVKQLEHSGTGLGIGVYRLGEKVIPVILLILAVAGIVDASYNPFLYFRF